MLDHTFGVAYGNIKSTLWSPDNGPGECRQPLKADWQGSIRLAADQHLILGLEHERDAISQPISASTTINSGYGELQSKFGEDFFDTVSLRYDDNDRFGGKATYRIAPAYFIKDTGTKLKASVGTGFKAPTLSEMYQSFLPFFFANPNLRPETSVGYDLGIEQTLLSDVVRLGATYFHNNIKDLIDSNPDFTSLTNIGRALTYGVGFRRISLAPGARLTTTEAFDRHQQRAVAVNTRRAFAR